MQHFLRNNKAEQLPKNIFFLLLILLHYFKYHCKAKLQGWSIVLYHLDCNHSNSYTPKPPCLNK